MRVSSVQNNNMTFEARLNILGKYFVSEEYHALIKKADKIGFENDIVELSYTNYRDKSIEFMHEKTPDFMKRISGFFKARFIPNGEGKGTELFKENLTADDYRTFWKMENASANKYLDRLAEKYPNERIGVSIIEN